MTHSEVFNQSRIDRCASIQRSIMSAWQKSNSFRYTARATAETDGLTLDELRKQYFEVGIDDVVFEIPFHDMLVVFSLIEQEAAALKAQEENPQPDFTISFKISTDFHDEEAARLLSRIHIETPFDTGKRLRVVVKEE